jgi:two-component system, cell cycle sensor histidine kinase and response regulator CckA
MVTPNRTSPERARILVLSDQESADDTLNRELERLPFPFTIQTAGNRSGLIEALHRSQPDLILYHDWHREMSELEALGLSRRHAPAVPFIIVDGALDEHTSRRCREAGATEVIDGAALLRLGPTISRALHRPVLPAMPLDGDAAVLRLIVESVSDLIAVVDPDGKRIYNSPSYTSLFGDPDLLRGTDSFAEIHPDDRARVRDVFERTVATGIGERTEYRFILPDGSVRSIESQGNVVRDADGKVTRVVVVSRDITARRQAEETLRRSEIRFRSLLEHSSDGIALIGRDGTISYASPSTENILGYPAVELVTTNGLTLIHPDDRPRAEEHLQELEAAPGRLVCAQYRILHRNGEWRWIDAVWRNMLHDPHVSAIVINYRDTTETRQVLEALKTSDEQHRAFAGQSTEGIWRIELDQPIPPGLSEDGQMAHILGHAFLAECNDTLARLYGLQRAEQLQGLYLKDLFRAGGWNNLEHLRTFLRSGYRLVNVESNRTDAAGATHYCIYNVVGILENGQLARAWGTHRDITEQKEAEDKAAILSQALRGISEGVYLTDLKGRIVFVNQALLAMYGYEEQELIGRPIDQLRGTRASDNDRASVAALHTGGWSGELTHCTKDGSQLRVALSASAVRSDSGETIALMGVVRDVTDRKRAEQLQDAVYRIAQAADAAASLNELYPAVHSIIQEVMPANNFYIALHDEAEDLMYFPYFVDEIDVPLPPMKPGKGLTAFVLRTGQSLLCTEDVWDDLVRRGEVELVGVPSPIWLGVPLIVASRTIGVMVVQHYSHAGAYGPIEQHMLEFVSSQVAKAIERKRNEEALRESEERFRRMFEDDLTGDFISTPEGKILACNPAFASIFGFASVEEALRSDCRVLHLTMEDRSTVFDLVRQKGKLEYHEMELRRKDGNPIFVVANLIGTFDEHERLTSVKGYLFDNTERKRLEDQLLQAQKMEAVGQLASGIAHDFNNVMSVTLTAAQMIRTAAQDETQTRRYAAMIEDTTLRGAAIAKQLLQFSRAEASKLTPISLGHVVNEVKKILDHSLPKTIVIRLAMNMKQGVIMGDEGQIHQLLLNLCINARDAMTAPGTKDGAGTLTISLESAVGGEISRKFGTSNAGEYAVLRVSDTGTGISPEVQRRIFEPFFTTKGIGKGTGLGLSIVHGIVKSHHGHVDVESCPGKGTTFSVYFPIVAQEISVAAQNAAGPARGRGETILIIEDEEILRTLMKEMLTRSGYHVVEAKDGEEGVRIFRSEHSTIAAVISDMGLPILSGEQVFHELRAVDGRVRLLFSTGYIRDEKRQELLDAGAKCFIHKPYRVDEMLKALRAVLDAP